MRSLPPPEPASSLGTGSLTLSMVRHAISRAQASNREPKSLTTPSPSQARSFPEIRGLHPLPSAAPAVMGCKATPELVLGHVEDGQATPASADDRRQTGIGQEAIDGVVG